MTNTAPVRPQLNVNSDPLPGKRQRVRGGDDEREAEGREDEDYECTEPGEANTEDVDDKDLFAGDPRGSGPNIPEHATSSPILCQPCGNARIPNKLSSPMKPSAEDVEQHNLTHFPYRSWCSACVKAKGREDAHPRDAQTEEDKTGLPIVSLDYQSINDDTEAEIKLIIGKCESTGNVIAHTVLCKGLGDEWVIRRIVRDLEELDKGHVILKTDGEPAIVAVQNRLQALRNGRTVPRNPPAYNPQSNGPCEKAVQDVTGHLRNVKIALEARLKTEIDDRLPIVQWALEHAVFLINKFSVGHDGMAPCERLTGRKWRRPMVEFGEMVLAKLALRRTGRGKAKRQKRKLAPRSIDAVWVGQIARTGEHLVIKPNGDAARCRTIRRVPVEHRWNAERVLLVKATPRLPAPSSSRPEVIESRVVDDEDHRAQRDQPAAA